MSYSIRYGPVRGRRHLWLLPLAAAVFMALYGLHVYGSAWYLALARACGALIDGPF